MKNLLMLVEGNDDKFAIATLLERHGLAVHAKDRLTIEFIHAAGGFDPLLEAVGPAMKSSKNIAIVIDADAPTSLRWSRLRAKLLDASLECPISPNGTPLVLNHPTLRSRIGIWMMPDNGSRGALEEFLQELIPNSDTDLLWGYADQAVVHAISLGSAIRNQDRLKARLHSWLAWQDSPGLPYGVAIARAYFAHDHGLASAFVSWTKAVAGEGSQES